ncbi:MAG: DUF4886 domain-containing protein [Dysgonamonadaceae bacterium]|jgi:hypothetical protein|nr:DUF4886 domain-containing protein [Dysgonamonadaceae bacterium]
MKFFVLKKSIFFTLVALCGFFFIAQSGAARTLKILAIGNSFSEDAVENYLYEIAQKDSITLIIGNMYIGGCSLEKHWDNAVKQSKVYSYRKIDGNGIKTTVEATGLSEVIREEEWDYITFQQVSQNAGIYETYFPYLIHLFDYVKSEATNPAVQFALHMTWAYAQTSTHAGFANYNNSQETMYSAIVDATFRVAETVGITIVIPSGTAIQNSRNSIIGDNLCRDGYHLNYKFGRYTAACTWYEKLTGNSVVGNPFIPEGVTLLQAAIAQNAAHRAVVSPQNISYILRNKEAGK